MGKERSVWEDIHPELLQEVMYIQNVLFHYGSIAMNQSIFSPVDSYNLKCNKAK